MNYIFDPKIISNDPITGLTRKALYLNTYHRNGALEIVFQIDMFDANGNAISTQAINGYQKSVVITDLIPVDSTTGQPVANFQVNNAVGQFTWLKGVLNANTVGYVAFINAVITRADNAGKF